MKIFVFLFSTIAIAVVLRVLIEVFYDRETEGGVAGVYLRAFAGLAAFAVYAILVWYLARG